MKTAIILHGTCDRDEFFDPQYSSLSNSHWLPWLQKQLIIEGYAAEAPEIPLAYQPDYHIWKTAFERYPLQRESVVIGHSCGAGFLVRWFSENPLVVARLVLVAPWLDPGRTKTTDFFDFTINPDLTRRMDVHLLHADNDESNIHKSVAMIRAALPEIHYHPFKGYGHFCFGDMNTAEFPALRDIALGEASL